MNIVRNIYCEGVFEGTYQLVRCCYEGYIWMIVESKEGYLRLNVKEGRDNYIYKSKNYHYGRTIPFKEVDLCE